MHYIASLFRERTEPICEYHIEYEDQVFHIVNNDFIPKHESAIIPRLLDDIRADKDLFYFVALWQMIYSSPDKRHWLKVATKQLQDLPNSQFLLGMLWYKSATSWAKLPKYEILKLFYHISYDATKSFSPYAFYRFLEDVFTGDQDKVKLAMLRYDQNH